MELERGVSPKKQTNENTVVFSSQFQSEGIVYSIMGYFMVRISENKRNMALAHFAVLYDYYTYSAVGMVPCSGCCSL